MNNNKEDEVAIALQNPGANSYLRSIFDRVDKDRNGRICVQELKQMINRGEFTNLDHETIVKILETSDKNEDGVLDFDEFVAMVRDPNLRNTFGHYVTNYVDFINGNRHRKLVSPFIFKTRFKIYELPVGMLLISMLETILYFANATDNETTSSGAIGARLAYDPTKREQIWRLVTYAFVHSDALHLVFNVGVQMAIGLPLELANGPYRLCAIYFTGVLAGSLATSVTDPATPLVGASGGVYALITAHIATIVMNYVETGWLGRLWLVLVTLVACYNVVDAILARYDPDNRERIAYVAHVAGAITGFLVGVNVVKNARETTCERRLWWICFVNFGGFVVFAILWNVLYPDYYP